MILTKCIPVALLISPRLLQFNSFPSDCILTVAQSENDVTATETSNITGFMSSSASLCCVFPPLHECSTALCVQNRLHQFLHIPTHFLLNLCSVESQLKLFC